MLLFHIINWVINIFIAHRGNDNHKYKENSIEALDYSLEQSYISGVELDIRMTLDKKIVLSHEMISDLKVIKNTKYKDLNLDLLDVFLKGLVTDKIILIEIKEEDNDTKIIGYLNKILRKYNLNFYIFSFNYDLIVKFKSKYPKYKCGLIVSKIINNKKDIQIFDFIAYKYNAYKDTSKITFVWTINDIKQYLKYKEKDAIIITDKAYLWYNFK